MDEGGGVDGGNGIGVGVVDYRGGMVIVVLVLVWFLFIYWLCLW